MDNLQLPTDPMERIVALALHGRINHVDGPASPVGLDFYLPDHGVHIEVKRMHSPRIAEQMSRADNVIAVQGEAAVRFFARLVELAGEHP